MIFVSTNYNIQVTTDVRQKCTEKHSGTSAAAPLASGMIALVLSVRSDLFLTKFKFLQ